MLGSTLLLSSILLLSVLLLKTFLLLQDWKKHQHICRTTTVRAQKHILRGMKELMALNPRATRLRIQRRLAEQSVKAAVLPQARAAAQAHLMMVISQQMRLARKQHSLIRQSRIQAQAEIRSQKLKLKRASIPFSILKTHPQSLTPNYILPPAGLEHLQKIEVTWTKKFKNKILNHQCGSTLTAQLNGGLKVKLLFPVASL